MSVPSIRPLLPPLAPPSSAGNRTRTRLRNSPPDSLYEGAFLRAVMTFPPDFPLRPPKMKFLTEMWHPNGALPAPCDSVRLLEHRLTRVIPDLDVQCTRMASCASRSCTSRGWISTATRTPASGGCPCTPSSPSCVQSLALSLSALRKLTLASHHAPDLIPLRARPAAHLGHFAAESGHARHELSRQRGRCGALALRPNPLLPRIATLTPSFGTMSLPSRPQKEVREDIATYRKKVRRLARRSAEEGFD